MVSLIFQFNVTGISVPMHVKLTVPGQYDPLVGGEEDRDSC